MEEMMRQRDRELRGWGGALGDGRRDTRGQLAESRMRSYG